MEKKKGFSAGSSILTKKFIFNHRKKRFVCLEIFLGTHISLLHVFPRFLSIFGIADIFVSICFLYILFVFFFFARYKTSEKKTESHLKKKEKSLIFCFFLTHFFSKLFGRLMLSSPVSFVEFC